MDVHDMYDFLGIYFASAFGMRHACDAGTAISLADSGGALVRSLVFYPSSGHHCIAYIWRGPGSGCLWTLHIAQYHFFCDACMQTRAVI
jgi:hypothetical protein